MYWMLIFCCLAIYGQAAVITHPSNPNYYRYAPDENVPFSKKTVSDQKIQERIQKKLKKWLATSYEGEIKFDVSQGNVTISGLAKTKWDKDDIESRVRSVEGVLNINNQLNIKDPSLDLKLLQRK